MNSRPKKSHNLMMGQVTPIPISVRQDSSSWGYHPASELCREVATQARGRGQKEVH